MKAARLMAAMLALALVVSAPIHADESSEQSLLSALPYLGSVVPEQQRRAEALIQRSAMQHFDALADELPRLERSARQRLLRILTRTPHDRRIPLCIGILCSPEANRAERTLARRALQEVPRDDLSGHLEVRIVEPDLPKFAQAQLTSMLGMVASARAQSLAESALAAAPPGSLQAFLAEDAVLRSAIESPFAQPAWSRYQERHPDAPRLTLRELQAALDDLARPAAMDRAAAQVRLNQLVGRDVRLLLALARSPWPERAGYALERLRAEPPRQLIVPAMTVLLDLAASGQQTAALLAVDVAITMRPPTADEMALFQPVTPTEAVSRLQAIVESIAVRGDLAELRLSNQRLSASLRPLRLRRGPMDPEVRRMSDELRGVRDRLEQLEEEWRDGWRRVFETEILESGSN